MPTPPTPVNVTNRPAPSNRRTSDSSDRRPTKLLNSAGRFCYYRRRAAAGGPQQGAHPMTARAYDEPSLLISDKLSVYFA